MRTIQYKINIVSSILIALLCATGCSFRTVAIDSMDSLVPQVPLASNQSGARISDVEQLLYSGMPIVKARRILLGFSSPVQTSYSSYYFFADGSLVISSSDIKDGKLMTWQSSRREAQSRAQVLKLSSRENEQH